MSAYQPRLWSPAQGLVEPQFGAPFEESTSLLDRIDCVGRQAVRNVLTPADTDRRGTGRSGKVGEDMITRLRIVKATHYLHRAEQLLADLGSDALAVRAHALGEAVDQICAPRCATQS